VNQSGDGRRARPQEKTRRKHAFHIEAIHQPAGKNLARGIRPEECRKQKAKLRRRDPKFVFDQGRRDREIAAIDVIDEDGKEKQNQHPRETRRQPRIVTFGRHGEGHIVDRARRGGKT
jgi:hypothetical protein